MIATVIRRKGVKIFVQTDIFQETASFLGAMMSDTQKPLSNDLIDSLLGDYKKPEDLIGENGLLKQLTKALVERSLQAEMTEHLGHSKINSCRV